MDQLEQAFRHYLKYPGVRQGIMIDGAWGTGKTYHFKNTLKPIAECLGFRVLYVSAFGLQTREDLSQSLFHAAHPALKNGFLQILGELIRLAFLRLGFDLTRVTPPEPSISRKTLICIDDLERAEATGLPSLLGVLNDYIEQKECRLLILCDDVRVASKQEQERSQYDEWREKLVGGKFRYAPSVKKQCVVALTIAQSRDFDSAWLSNDICETFNEIARLDNCINIRTMISALDSYRIFRQSIFPADFQLSAARELMAFRTVISLALLRGRSADQASKLKDLFQDGDDLLQWRPTSMHGDDPILAFRNKYGGLYGRDLLTIPSLYRLVMDGTIDIDSIRNEMRAFFPETEYSPFDIVTSSYGKVSDSQLFQALNDCLVLLERGEITDWDKLARLSSALFFFSARRALEISANDLKIRLFKAIEIAKNSVQHKNYPLDVFSYRFENHFNAEHEAVISKIKEEIQAGDIDRWNRERQRIMSLLGQDNVDEFAVAIHGLDSVTARAQLFSSTDAVTISSYIIEASTKEVEIGGERITKVADALYARYAQTPSQRNSEAEFLSNLQLALKNLMEVGSFRRKFPRSAVALDAIFAGPSATVTPPHPQ